MARYALRNKERIQKHFESQKSGSGRPTLDRIVKSLEAYFKQGLKEEDVGRIDEEPFDTLIIYDLGYKGGIIAFYVIWIRFDVYLLAFKEFVN